MTRRPDGLVSLLDGEPSPERTTPAGGSPHSSFDQLRPPAEDFDLDRARAVCAEITRQLLRDFAPAMTLLQTGERRRVQALVAYARTLLDFAGEGGMEGERLSQINRWQFALDQALGGEPPGQPVFVALAAAESVRPWPRQALDELSAVARRRITSGPPATGEAVAAAYRRLTEACVSALTGTGCPSSLAVLGEALLRLQTLLGWRDRLFHLRPDLGLTADDPCRFGAVVAKEAAVVRRLLEGTTAATEAPGRHYARVARFVRAAAVALLDRIDDDPEAAEPPQLGVASRLRLLVTARVRARRTPSKRHESRG